MFAVLAGVGAGVAWQVYVRDKLSKGGPTGPEKPSAVAVEVAPVESGIVRDARVLSGTLEASTRFVVAAKVGGLIEQVVVDLGDRIRRDQVVAEIDDAEFVQAVVQAEAELAVRKAASAQADSAFELARREYDRTVELEQRAMASQAELDEKTAAYESAKSATLLTEAQVQQAAASLELARIRLRYTQVRASWSSGPDEGIVGERFQDAGNTVQPGDAIVSVVALDPLTAVVSITERDYARLSVGQHAALQADALPERAFRAEVVRISPVFRESSRQARIELRVDNHEQLLKPGMFARVSLVLREEQADAIVPLAALTRRAGSDVVFVLAADGRRVHQRPVRVGVIEGDRAQVIGEGIEGRVVVLGQQLLEEGGAVIVSERHIGRPPAAGANGVAP
jgi:RND family efflux transporter MFP subunit